jgi:ABC-type multidrug transport system fused ATPase/permease subunit
MAPLACVLATLGWITLPEIILIAQLCRYLIQFTNNLGVALTSFGSHSVAYGRLKTILDLPSENTGEGEPVTMDGDDLLTLSHVDISYGDNKILADVNLNIKSGEIVALLGPSGSGKSSLVKVLLGLIDYCGEIKIYGKELSTLSLQELRRSISYVPEQSDLFDATVYENISYADPSADISKIKGVLDQAALDEESDFSLRETGENGNKLSGGQRQRVAIARALLKDVPLVILDEPTASLDTISESKILKMITQLKAKGKAVILITHRESTMKIADRIMVIQDKSISENVPPDKAARSLLQ